MEQMTIKQPVELTWSLDAAAEEVREHTQDALNLVGTRENLPAIKRARAALNKERDLAKLALSAARAQVLAPFERFEAEYNLKIIAAYRDADAVLKETVDGIEDEIRDERRAKLMDYIKLRTGTEDASLLPDKILLSASEKSLREQIDEKLAIERIEAVLTFDGTEEQLRLVIGYAAQIGADLEEV